MLDEASTGCEVGDVVLVDLRRDHHERPRIGSRSCWACTGSARTRRCGARPGPEWPQGCHRPRTDGCPPSTAFPRCDEGRAPGCERRRAGSDRASAMPSTSAAGLPSKVFVGAAASVSNESAKRARTRLLWSRSTSSTSRSNGAALDEVRLHQPSLDGIGGPDAVDEAAVTAVGRDVGTPDRDVDELTRRVERARDDGGGLRPRRAGRARPGNEPFGGASGRRRGWPRERGDRPAGRGPARGRRSSARGRASGKHVMHDATAAIVVVAACGQVRLGVLHPETLRWHPPDAATGDGSTSARSSHVVRGGCVGELLGWRDPGAPERHVRGPAGRRRRGAREQRRREDDAAARALREPPELRWPARRRHDLVRRPRAQRALRGRGRPHRSGAGTRGPAYLRPAHRRGEPPHRRVHAP